MVNDKTEYGKNECTETRVCSKCGRELPLERFAQNGWCKNCNSFNSSKARGFVTEKNLVRIERLYKAPIPTRILDTEQANIELINPDECFVRLINYKNAWISNYGRPLEYNNGKYVIKRTKENEAGEKVCTLQKNVYNGEKWIWEKQTIEVWRLVVGIFIVNFDMVGNTHCWHKDNNKADNYYKNIYPMNDKQYNAVLERYTDGADITDELITDIVNDIKYKVDDWYANKWKRTVFGIGYLGCSDADANRTNNYIYSKWANMMQRCYDEETHRLKPYYAPCNAEIEWHNFSNYRLWHKENEMGDRKVDLDKDVLVQGNTVYGSETCTLISHFTNTIFEERGADANIVQNNATGKYDVTMSVLGKKEDVGSFDTVKEAKQGYIDYKQDYIREIAKKCKGKVPNKTYEAMKEWKVKIA